MQLTQLNDILSFNIAFYCSFRAALALGLFCFYYALYYTDKRIQAAEKYHMYIHVRSRIKN